MIILIASVSVMVSYFSVRSIPALQEQSETQSIKTMNEIPASIDEYEPDAKYFNEEAINPTVEVIIGEGGEE